MLGLLIESGYQSTGFDTNPEMVKVCRSSGLPMLQDVGIQFLEQTEDGILRGAFCGLVVEHLLTCEVERLVQLAYEKLLPNPVMVVEAVESLVEIVFGNQDCVIVPTK